METILIRNVQTVIDDTVCRHDLLIQDGLLQVAPENSVTVQADRVIDGTDLTALPGLFDMHVHFRDPGQTHKEDILTGSAAALAGGITGVACMPNTKPTLDSPELIHYVIDKAKSTGVKVLPVGCITGGMQGKELTDFQALKDAGICALSDDGRPVENAEMMRQALIKAYALDIPVVSHCEDLSIINGGIVNNGLASETLGVKGMDRSSEDYITAREIILAASTNTRIHICHVSTKGSVEIIRHAKSLGVNVTCETCPHYFLMTETAVLTGDADYRMNPPLRTEEDRQAVLEGVLDGTIDCIVTDHAPHAPEEKANFYTAPNGVIGMETSLAASLQLVHSGKMTLPELVKKMAINPRNILHLPQVALESGKPAELVLVAPDYEWTVDPEKMHSKAKNVIWKHQTLRGKAIMTITDGIVRYEDEEYFEKNKR